MPQPWLVDVKRRTLMDIKESLRPSQIYRLITAKTWPYKTQMEFYHARDRTLMVLLYLTCGRVTEFLSLKKSQFVLDEDPDFARACNSTEIECPFYFHFTLHFTRVRWGLNQK